MPRKVHLHPPPGTRSMMVAQIILAVMFLLFGAMIILAAEGEARPYAFAFGLIWCAGCIALIIGAARGLLLAKQGKIEIAELGDEKEVESSNSFAARLRDLEALKAEHLISEEEYRSKRAEIMGEKW